MVLTPVKFSDRPQCKLLQFRPSQLSLHDSNVTHFLLTTELAALEFQKISHRLIMGKWCLHASSFIFLSNHHQLLVTRTGIKAGTSSISGLWFPWPIYMFLKREDGFCLEVPQVTTGIVYTMLIVWKLSYTDIPLLSADQN